MHQYTSDISREAFGIIRGDVEAVAKLQFCNELKVRSNLLKMHV
jgi:hypothetical protein